jgi:hypothetical protein
LNPEGESVDRLCTDDVGAFMHSTLSVTDAASLRQHLTAADPFQRAMGLHALEVEAERCAGSLRSEATRFAERGIPYYALHDPHFQDWVGKAVSYWERLRTPARARRAAR